MAEPEAADGTQQAQTDGKAKAKPALTKKEALRRAMRIAGPDATPTELRQLIKKRFKIDMTNDHISTTKSDLRREMAAAQEEQAATAPKAAVVAALAPAAGAGQASGSFNL